ncbi:MAG: hypothetical protein ACLUG4_06770 [Bacilli bacterium]
MKYHFDDYKCIVTNSIDRTLINLPFKNDLIDKISLIKEMYNKFVYE